MVQNRGVVFAQVPDGIPVPGKHLIVTDLGDFDLESTPSEDGFTCKVLHASLDPYLRLRMVPPEAGKDGFEPLTLGDVIPNTIIIQVIKSNSSRVASNEILIGMGPIQQYASIDAAAGAQFTPLPDNPYSLDLKFFLGPLGMPGLTAFAALYEVGKSKKGETILISAATGAVGQIVGQLALREGLTVLGSAGTDDKVKILTDVFGFHGAFNHNRGVSQLKRIAPNGIDIYYDNVGGEQLEAAIDSLNAHGRIVACGYASQYNKTPDQMYGIKNTNVIIAKCIRWCGFNVFDDHVQKTYSARHQEAVSKWIVEGSFVPVLSETTGIGQAAEALAALFAGRNVGKSILHMT